MSEENYYIYGINGPVITVRGGRGLPMMSLVYVGEDKIPGEVVSASGETTVVQVYEDSAGLGEGQPVEATGRPMSVLLGPGMISNIYDGIARPLRAVEAKAGSFITRGITVPALDLEKEWDVKFDVKNGDEAKPGMAAVVGASLIATLSFLFTEKSYSSANNGGLATMLGGLLAVVMVLAIIAACFLVFFIICAQFYRNLMTDEGYLTFTLPVKTSEILWSKLITAMLWTIISSVVIGLCVLMFVGLSTAASGDGRQMLSQISDALRQMFALFNTQSALIVFEAVLCGLVMLARSVYK